MSANAIRFRRSRKRAAPAPNTARNLLPIEPCASCKSPGALKGATTRWVECTNEYCAATGPQGAGATEAVNLWNLVMKRCSCGASNGGRAR